MHDGIAKLVQPSTINRVSPADIGTKRTRHGACRAALSVMSGERASNSTIEIGTMATELLLVGLTLALYAVCALFVRVCDRI
jgi:hypothetical protein